jgi:hypothetical protein
MIREAYFEVNGTFINGQTARFAAFVLSHE